LKAYGEGWITKRIAYSHAYASWLETPGYTNEYSSVKESTYSELTTYEEENEPAFVKAANEATSGNSAVRSEFRTLYEQIADMYELNYDWGSNKCTEMQMLNIVYCDVK
jgi:hypothetical protein